MRLALTLLLIFTLAPWREACAATGNTNVIGGWIDTDGFTLKVVMGGDTATTFGTNLQVYGGFLSSLSTNYHSLQGTQKCTLTIGTSNWTSTGASQAGTRTIYATKIRRWHWPMFNTNRVYEVDATNVIVDIALSDFVYAGETISLTARAGWIVNTNGGAVDSAAVTGLTVTNLSALTFGLHSEPSMNWAQVGQQRWTNSTERVWLKGGHWSGIAAVRVRAIDENANTQHVWAAHVATSPGRGSRKGYWVADIPTTTFTNFDRIRLDYWVYPKVGTNIFDTRLDRWTGPTPLPSSQTNFWDRFNAFTNFAVVGLPVGASPAVTNGSPSNVHPDNYFGTVDAAYNALPATNNLLRGINEPIGIVYVRAGVSNISGGTATSGNTARSWAILRNYPGEVARFTNTTGHADVSDCWKVEGDTDNGGGLVLDMDSPLIPFSGVQRLWIDNVQMDSASSQFISSCANVTFTDVTITKMGMGLAPFSAENTSFALLRDVDIGGINGQVWIYTAIGLTRRGLTNTSFSIINTRHSSAGHNVPFAAHNIFCDSDILQLPGLQPVNLGQSGGSPTNDVLHGMWSENIIIESTNASASSAMFASGNTTNVVFRNWTIRGARNQMFYNELTNWWHLTPRIYNCIFQNTGYACDLVPQNNPYLTNNASYLHQVGCSGNVYSHIVAVEHNWPDFTGINNLIPGTVNGDFPVTIVNFQRLAAWVGTSPVAGNGDYDLMNNNIFWGTLKPYQPAVGFDRKGRPRSQIDGPGDSVAGSPKKRALF